MSKSLKKLIDINRLREFKNKLVGMLSNYVTLNGAQTISGAKTLSADTLTGLAGNGYRIINGSSKVLTSTGYGVFQKIDSNAWYLMVTAKDDALGSWTIARPAQLALSTGILNINGNAATATKLAAKRTIALSGAATGTATSFDGTANIAIPVTSLDASKLTGTASVSTTGNAASATKLAAKRTIALSGAATGTATGFDGSGNITIPVTALSGSAITSAITIYDLVPDGAASHRNFYRGKDLTAAFNAGTVSTNIANGTFRDIFPGDYITKSITVPQILKADGTTEYIAQKTYTVKFIIADLDIWLNRGDTATTAHHVAIVPERVVFNSIMNETNTTEGGYLGSFMNTNVMPAFATALQNAFGASHLISFRIGLSNGVTTTTASASHPYWTGTSNWWGAWTSEICCLMSEGMVYGQSPNHSAAMDETMCGQFAAFRLNSSLVYNRQNYWLSDVVSSAHFADVSGYGLATTDGASYVSGVRPFALLK